MEALVAKGITKRYAHHLALDDVSLTIPSGSIYGLLGPNGAGKTTMIRIVNQIIDPDEGEILINGKKLTADHISIIGYLPEERGLYKQMKVGDHLIYLGQLRNLSKKDAVIRSKAWTKKLGIYDWWDRKVEDLSKGMAQKIQFIATVVNEPKLIILDEPFSGFDPVNANLIKDEILELRDSGSTIIFSTHRMESVEELCDHIALINRSKVILEGSKKEIKKSYQSGTYLVEHAGAFRSSTHFSILKTELLEDNFYRSIVKVAEGTSPNFLLERLIAVTEVHSFVEKIPAISEIFIAKVEEDSQ